MTPQNASGPPWVRRAFLWVGGYWKALLRLSVFKYHGYMSDDKNVISDEAVDAAARACLAEAHPHADWNKRSTDSRRFYREQAARILEAAAPYTLAPAFEEGYGWGYSDAVWSKAHAPRDRNPYRSKP